MKSFFGIGWGIISAGVTSVSSFFYMKAIYTRKLQKPVMSTLSLWLIIGVILFLTSVQSGARWDTTLFPILMGVINPAIVIVLSLRYGQYTWEKIDTMCTCICCITILVWQVTESALLGLFGGIIADVFATAPMVVKSWRNPQDEPIFPWITFALASALNILAVKEWEISHWLFPVYMTIMGLVISFPLVINYFKKIK